jgi:hypothetical protein
MIVGDITQTASYSQARSLAHALAEFGIITKPETLEMTTSGIYIPRWEGYSRIPHAYVPASGLVQWYFFLRFSTGQADINVGQALDFSNSKSVPKLAEKMHAAKGARVVFD